MGKQKHIVIYSHGAGVLKDDRGLFTYLANGLPEVESILFDYGIIDETLRTLTSRTIKEQAEMLTEIIRQTQANNPEAQIDIIAHSQGAVVAALAHPQTIRKVFFVAPAFDLDINRTLDRYRDWPGTEINLDGLTRFPSIEGFMKVFPAEYWRERQSLQPFALYNAFAEHAEITAIIAKQDHILSAVDLRELSEKITVLSIDGDHEFSGAARQSLLDTIRPLILE